MTSMSIIKQQHCPTCKAITYQRYQSCLRCRLTTRTHWLCLTCRSRIHGDGTVERSTRPRPPKIETQTV